jgi:hypothetical protein
MVIKPIEEVSNPQDSTREEAQTMEAMPLGTTSTAISARCKGIDKRNAKKESRKTNPATTPKKEHTGPEST